MEKRFLTFKEVCTLHPEFIEDMENSGQYDDEEFKSAKAAIKSMMKAGELVYWEENGKFFSEMPEANRGASTGVYEWITDELGGSFEEKA